MGWAERLAVRRFNAAWHNVADGCGVNCAECGVSAAKRVAFGYSVKIEYTCGMKPADTPGDNRTDARFVSVLGPVHRLTKP